MSDYSHSIMWQEEADRLHCWLIEDENTSWNIRALGTQAEVDLYLENNPHLCNPRAVDYQGEFEGCIEF